MRLLALLLLAGPVLLPSCAQLYSEEQVAKKEAAWQSSSEALKRYQAELEGENAFLSGQVDQLKIALNKQAAVNALEAVAVLDQDFEALRKQIEGIVGRTGDVQYLMGPDGPVLRISDHVLFGSGSATVSKDGAVLLGKLAGSLMENGLAFRVEGHTDNQQVKVQAKQFPRGNLQLSASRAIEVAAVLIEKGLPAERVAVAGYGEWRPVSENSTAEGRARNRRVEIAVITAAGSDGR
ncbi:MAG: OmpA family protein [Planctomycetes bacterium]|nr:OmpA family protein [Planctomycetota bacterium]